MNCRYCGVESGTNVILRGGCFIPCCSRCAMRIRENERKNMTPGVHPESQQSNQRNV